MPARRRVRAAADAGLAAPFASRRLNTADTGLIVDGNHVTAYGLSVEHYQKSQVIWNGEHGRIIVFQTRAAAQGPGTIPVNLLAYP